MTYSKTSRGVCFSTGSWLILLVRLAGLVSTMVPGAAAALRSDALFLAISSASAVSSIGLLRGRCGGLGGVLDEEGRLELVLDLGVLGQHLAALGGGGERPVDGAHGALRVGEADGPGLVLFVEGGFADGAELVLLDDGLEAGLHLDQLRGSLAVGGLEVLLLGGRGAFVGEELGEVADDLLVAQALVDLVEEAEVLVELRHEGGELGALDLLLLWRRR